MQRKKVAVEVDAEENEEVEVDIKENVEVDEHVEVEKVATGNARGVKKEMQERVEVKLVKGGRGGKGEGREKTT